MLKKRRHFCLLLLCLSFVLAACGLKIKEDGFSEKSMYEKALKPFEKAEKQKGKFRFTLAPLEFLTSLEEAEVAIDDYLFLFPRGEHAPELSFKKAQLFDYGMRQQFDMALRRYEEVLRKFPRSDEAFAARERIRFIRTIMGPSEDNAHGQVQPD